MNTTILFIDGENFVHKIEEVLENKKINKHKIDIASVNFSNLFNKTLSEFKLSRKIFYAAKLHFHPETRQKSEELIKLQRKLRNNLINQGYEFVMAGNVRAQKIGNKIAYF